MTRLDRAENLLRDAYDELAGMPYVRGAVETRAEIRAFLDEPQGEPEQDSEPGDQLAGWAWTIIANALGGDWSLAPDDWRQAAERWRDEYHTTLKSEQGASEMLEALADRAKTSTCGVCYDPILNLWFAWPDSQKAHSRKDRDDALRAALEAVGW